MFAEERKNITNTFMSLFVYFHSVQNREHIEIISTLIYYNTVKSIRIMTVLFFLGSKSEYSKIRNSATRGPDDENCL